MAHEVLCNSFRNPAHLAKMVATAQALSGGRVILGIGAGWNEEEYRAYGWPYLTARTRIAQLAEAIQLIAETERELERLKAAPDTRRTADIKLAGTPARVTDALRAVISQGAIRLTVSASPTRRVPRGPSSSQPSSCPHLGLSGRRFRADPGGRA